MLISLMTNANDARDQFAIIVEQYPDDYDMLYSLALLSMEINPIQ